MGREFGPVRPVLPMLDTDRLQLVGALGAAGGKAVGSVASAVEQVYFEARERFGPWNQHAAATADYGERTLTAGWPGNPEAVALMDLMLFGNELNLHPHEGLDVAVMRRTGPDRQRVDVGARQRIAEVLRRWTNSSDRYTEVADNLAVVVSSFVDEEYGPEGWSMIADQWLQPVSPARRDFEVCYGLLYARSTYRRDTL